MNVYCSSAMLINLNKRGHETFLLNTNAFCLIILSVIPCTEDLKAFHS